MDLVGIDVGFEVSKSFYAQSFGEPRWRPSMLAARKVASGDLGRKTGRGWYEYPEGGEHRPPDPPTRRSPAARRLVVIAGWTPLADELREAAEAAGWRVADPEDAAGDDVPALVVDCGGLDARPSTAPRRVSSATTRRRAPGALPCRAARRSSCATRLPLAELDPEGTAAGFFAAVPLGGLVELTRSPTTSDAAARAAEAFFALARPPRRVGRRRARPRARPDRLPARQRGVLRARRRRRRGRGHRRRHGARPQPPARPARVGRRDRRRPRCSACSPASTTSTARSATAPAPALLRAVRTGTPLRP